MFLFLKKPTKQRSAIHFLRDIQMTSQGKSFSKTMKRNDNMRNERIISPSQDKQMIQDRTLFVLVFVLGSLSHSAFFSKSGPDQ